MNRSENLYSLQRIDSKLDEHHRRLKVIQTILEDDREINAARATADSADLALKEATKNFRNAKAVVQEQRDKIELSESRLYSGSVSNPKELEDIQNEVTALNRYLDVVEERQLETMLSVDEAQEVYDEAHNQLAVVLANNESKHADLLEEKSEVESAVVKIEGQRKIQLNEIEAGDLEFYEDLRLKRAGVAVAKVQDRNCTACGSTLASAMYQQARSPSKIIICDSCGRILYAE
jgi:predicted  nucleic acid-binding Zn-ribbon protein